MSENKSPEQRSGDPSATPPPAQSGSSQRQLEAEKKRALADAINNILKGIPFIGPYIIIIKLKWGWGGILLFFGGFLVATALIATGFFPDRAVSSRYQSNGSQTNAAPDYELKAQKDILWDAAVQNAKSRIRATGVALSKLDPKLVAERVKAGVAVQLVYVNPCGETVKQRQKDENNPHASMNITSVIRKFGDFTRDFNTSQNQLLQIKRTDTYPTMVVVIIDNDLYTYFCPYGAECSTSPVLVFKGYSGKTPMNPSAAFFEKAVNATCSRATLVTDYSNLCGGASNSSAPPATAPSASPAGSPP